MKEIKQAGAGKSSRRRVLIAEDEPVLLRVVSSVVEKEGCEAVAARDGRAAMQELELGRPLAACMFDMMLPHVEDTELLKFMRADERLRKVPVMMMTAEPDPRHATEGFPRERAGPFAEAFHCVADAVHAEGANGEIGGVMSAPTHDVRGSIDTEEV
ncbi:MAG: response regulator [Pyrinomonadaceae bacterium]